ncbi:MAG: hypothetical protein OXL36_01955 [Bryobacterales bacterium]|nr:hypothetical protein [Bryobacterales bacterium]MDE0295552.1 hypothetical protein [Bryobacterales bacterium]
MTRRRFMQLAVFVSAYPEARADQAAVSRMLRDASRALQARNAALFLNHFDRERFEAYPQLEANVVVLTEQRDLASSIRIEEIVEEGDFFRVQIDWLLQISPLGRAGSVETRRSIIDVRVSLAGTKWRIVAFTPVEFLRPV